MVRSPSKPGATACAGNALADKIAHDINNALMPILTYTELLLLDPARLDDREIASRYLTAIENSAKDAVTAVRRLQKLCGGREREESLAAWDPSDSARAAAR